MTNSPFLPIGSCWKARAGKERYLFMVDYNSTVRKLNIIINGTRH